MTNVELNNPYKIITSKHKRYASHYGIPSPDVIVVAKKKYGDQVLSDVMWKTPAGEVEYRSDLIFDSANLEPLNRSRDFHLLALWMQLLEQVHLASKELPTT